MAPFFGFRKAACIGMFWGTFSLMPGLDALFAPAGFLLSLPARLTLGPRPFFTILVSTLITTAAYAAASSSIKGRRGGRLRRRRRNEISAV